LRKSKPEKKKCTPSPEDIAKAAKAEIDAKLDEVLALAEENGCINLRRDHLKPLLMMPGALDEENEKQLVAFLRDLDFRVKLAWEEQISAYIRVPVQSMFRDSRTSPFPWR
jgi:hypothetical protein